MFNFLKICVLHEVNFFFDIVFELELRSPDWKHDMYDTGPIDDGKPSSTTQI